MVAHATVTKTIVVNPAFLQEIKDSNPALKTTLEQLRELYQADGTIKSISDRLTRLLDELRDQLALQFSLEESYGYLEVPHAPSQALAELAAQAKAEHGILYLQLSDLAEQAEELQYRGVESRQLGALIERTRAFDDALRVHEQLEDALIQGSSAA